MKRQTTLSLLLLIVAGSSVAMESRLELLGFSADGAFVAFQESGYLSDIAEAFSRVYIVDVAANDFVVPPFSASDSGDPESRSSLEQLRVITIAQARSDLVAYGIIPGNTGCLLYERSGHDGWPGWNDLSEEVLFALPPGEEQFHYAVVLEEREVDSARCRALAIEGMNPRIFTLSLRNEYAHWILQHDTVLYASRNCPYAYEIYRVYVYGDSLAVFVSSITPSLDEPHVYRLIVTGTLDRCFRSTISLPEGRAGDPATAWTPEWAASLPIGAPGEPLPAELLAILRPIPAANAFSLSAPVGTTIAMRVFLDGTEPGVIAGTTVSRHTNSVLDVSELGRGTFHYRVEAYIVLPNAAGPLYVEVEGEVEVDYGLWSGEIVIQDNGSIVLIATYG
jgi:predicted secreted protein